MSLSANAGAGGMGGSRPGLAVEAAGLGRYRWVICSRLFLATTVNYIDRQILALVKAFLGR